MALAKPTYPTGTTSADLLPGELLECLPGDRVFISMGAYATKAAVEAAFVTKVAIAAILASSFDELGELGEKAVKADSKGSKLKSRHFTYPGKRSNTIEVYLAGIGSLQKDFLESNAFQGKECVIAILSEDYDRALIMNGLTWAFDWSAADDAITTGTITSEFGGSTASRIVLIKDIEEGEA